MRVQWMGALSWRYARSRNADEGGHGLRALALAAQPKVGAPCGVCRRDRAADGEDGGARARGGGRGGGAGAGAGAGRGAGAGARARARARRGARARGRAAAGGGVGNEANMDSVGSRRKRSSRQGRRNRLAALFQAGACIASSSAFACAGFR